jgi:hypothetical protein
MFNKWGAMTRHDGERGVRRNARRAKAPWLIRRTGKRAPWGGGSWRNESDDKCYTSTADEGSMRIRGLRGGVLFENERRRRLRR